MIATPKHRVGAVTGIDPGADSALGYLISTADVYWLRHSPQRKPMGLSTASGMEDPGEGFAAPVSAGPGEPPLD